MHKTHSSFNFSHFFFFNPCLTLSCDSVELPNTSSKKKKMTVEIAQTVATLPRQLHYLQQFIKKKKNCIFQGEVVYPGCSLLLVFSTPRPLFFYQNVNLEMGCRECTVRYWSRTKVRRGFVFHVYFSSSSSSLLFIVLKRHTVSYYLSFVHDLPAASPKDDPSESGSDCSKFLAVSVPAYDER